ncbi:uncharacterized protein LOC144903451 [Branchiostoma floridae x Branchiostoma belcheri]
MVVNGRTSGLLVISFVFALVESSNTPYPMTVRGMVGDRVTLRGKFQESLDGVIAITWSKIDSADGGSRNAVAIWSPSGKDARDMTFDPLKERTALNRDGSLTLQPAVSADQGLYVQTVLIDGVGQKEYYVAVEIHVPPTVRLSMPRRGEAVEHTTLSIHCSVENTSALVSPIYWTKDGSIIDTSLRMSVTLKSGDNIRNTSLVIPYVERKDGGNYSCVAEYLTGFQAASVLLDVLYAAKIINISNPIVPFVGESVELLCQAEGNPTPNVTWYKAGLGEPIAFVRGVNRRASASVTIPELKTNESQDYLCVASNDVADADFKSVFISFVETAAMTEVISPVRRLFKIAIIAGSVAGGVLVLTAILLVALTVCRRDKHRAAWTQCQLVNVVPPIPESEMEVAPNNCDEDFDKLAHDGDISPDRCVARAIMPYEVSEPGLLHLNVNDVVEVLKTGNDGWWFGYCQGKVGAFPAACVEILTKPDTLSRGRRRSSSTQVPECECSYATLPLRTHRCSSKEQIDDRTLPLRRCYKTKERSPRQHRKYSDSEMQVDGHQTIPTVSGRVTTNL